MSTITKKDDRYILEEHKNIHKRRPSQLQAAQGTI